MLNGENMENITALYGSYLHFTFGTNLVHTFPRAYGILVVLPAFLYKFMFEFWVKDAAGTIDHVQIVSASPGRLSRIHAGVTRLLVTLSGCVSSTFRFSTISVRLTCLHAF